jgi:adhesin transport system membrane fusion protein
MKDDGYQTKRHTGKLKHHLLLALLLLFVVSFVLWADNFNLEVVSVAEGEVKPKGETKSIQHLEGGIVKEILVEEGEEVSKGNSLMILESTLSDADVKELQARQDFLKIQTIRLKAEIRGSGGIRFPRQLAKNNSELIQQEKELHAARRKKLLNELKIADEKINQRKQEINEANAEIREIEARLKNNRNSLVLINEQVAISEDLLKDDLTNRYNHLNLLKESNLLKSRIEEDMAVLSRLAAVVLRQKSSVRDTRSLKENINLMFSQEVHTQLEERQKEFRETRERLRKAKDNLKRTVLRSPVNGIVKKIRIVTKGGVVPPGGKVIDIIPAEGGLVVEARMPPYDIGYVSVGQKGTIKLKSTDAIRFGNVAVKVAHISPDTFADSDGSAYYKVILEPETDYFEKKSTRYNLVPGVEVVSSIHTGERSVLKYIFEPFLTSADSAFQER